MSTELHIHSALVCPHFYIHCALVSSLVCVCVSTHTSAPTPLFLLSLKKTVHIECLLYMAVGGHQMLPDISPFFRPGKGISVDSIRFSLASGPMGQNYLHTLNA